MKSRIHIVEDDPKARMEAAECLLVLGVPVVLHLGTVSFISRLEEVSDIDVVIMDWRQPGITCLDLSRAIEHQSKRPYVVLWTALGPDEVIPTGLVRERVRKGTGLSELFSAVKKGLAVRQRELVELMENLEGKPKGAPPGNGNGDTKK